MGVLLTNDDLAGESKYESALPGIVNKLAERGLLEESDGAKVVYLDGWKNREGEPLPLICLLYTSPSPRDYAASRMPSSA